MENPWNLIVVCSVCAHNNGAADAGLTVPNRMRGQTMSIAYCGVNLLGTGLGPFLVGFLNERLFMEAAQRSACAWPP
jgi:hypothetical protein